MEFSVNDDSIGAPDLSVNSTSDLEGEQNLRKKFSPAGSDGVAVTAETRVRSATYRLRRGGRQSAPVVEGGQALTDSTPPMGGRQSLHAQARLLPGTALSDRHLDVIWDALHLKDEITLLGMACAQRPNLMTITIDLTGEHVQKAIDQGVTVRRWIADRRKTVQQQLSRTLGHRPDVVLLMEPNLADKRADPADEPEIDPKRPLDLHGVIEVREPAHIHIIEQAFKKVFQVPAWDWFKGKSKPVLVAAADDTRGGIEGWIANYACKRLFKIDMTNYTGGSSPIIKSRSMGQATKGIFTGMVREQGVEAVLEILEQRRRHLELDRLDRRVRRRADRRLAD